MKLNLGCGKDLKPGWINVDNFDEASFDKSATCEGIVRHDLRAPLPYDSNSVDYIFSEHLIEHLVLSEGQQLLNECYRVLQPSGVLRISTPDLWLMARAYTEADRDVYAGLGMRASTDCELFNQGMRDWGHQYCYDENDLVHRLQKAGFELENIKRVYHGESEHKELRKLETRKPALDMVLEAIK